MAEKLKNLFFTQTFLDKLCTEIKSVYSEFDKKKFLDLVHIPEWNIMELKQRMRHISECLYQTLPEYPRALEILKQVAPRFSGFDAMVFPDFVEKYGLDHREISLRALYSLTKKCSSEFAIRPFIVQNLDHTIQQMITWADDEDPMVRRLASEGCRPRLPWAMALPALKKNPRPILPILEKLKDDESESVRRSVANNLNDISKDNPELALEICKRWYGTSENVNILIKHACRDMLKSGNKEALILFGFADPEHVFIENFQIDKNTIKIGDDIQLSCDIRINEKKKVKLRLEYIVYYMKANGKYSPKIFQIKENSFMPGMHSVRKKHSFQDFSTRKHYAGEHIISFIVNGEEKARASLILKK
jgi:3-methyladenine DNA glycosylase AlkC